MKTLSKIILTSLLSIAISCNKDDETPIPQLVNTAVNFEYKTTIKVGNLGASEISATTSTLLHRRNARWANASYPFHHETDQTR